MGLRPDAFFAAVAAFFGAACPFCLAQRALWAAAILARADALMVRRLRPVAWPDCALGGRPRPGAGELSPTRAAIACSIRLASCRSCFTRD